MKWRERRECAAISRRRECSCLRGPAKSEPSVDRWLQRLSHVAQFGLFVFSIGTIYFTVIPLYQKAVLEEAIAQKEMELRAATSAAEEAYARLRAAALKDYVFFAGLRCSGLLEPTEVPSHKKRRNGKPDLPKILTIDPPGCLASEGRSAIAFKELRPGDLELLQTKVTALAEDLKVLRGKMVNEYLRAPELVAAQPDAYPRPTGFGGEMLTFLEGRTNGTVYEQSELELKISEEQLRIEAEYGKAIRDRIAKLRSIEWSKQVGDK